MNNQSLIYNSVDERASSQFNRTKITPKLEHIYVPRERTAMNTTKASSRLGEQSKMLSDNLTQMPSFMKYEERNGIITGRASLMSYDINNSSIMGSNHNPMLQKYMEVYSNEGHRQSIRDRQIQLAAGVKKNRKFHSQSIDFPQIKQGQGSTYYSHNRSVEETDPQSLYFQNECEKIQKQKLEFDKWVKPVHKQSIKQAEFKYKLQKMSKFLFENFKQQEDEQVKVETHTKRKSIRLPHSKRKQSMIVKDPNFIVENVDEENINRDIQSQLNFHQENSKASLQLVPMQNSFYSNKI
ncbi:UNKNOWN [Stylonychia lemnae]|uniref:Uncharacterized protein n=1 Tax=Stylonychia lemnae TaxID=5949 RepID=A0A078ASB2_STYLE|nr:UNKNOWN [Stylonychia lemnae]|eukprot:CDW84856.1 UNKNOWN [Stylonychia lemnae]